MFVDYECTRTWMAVSAVWIYACQRFCVKSHYKVTKDGKRTEKNEIVLFRLAPFPTSSRLAALHDESFSRNISTKMIYDIQREDMV